MAELDVPYSQHYYNFNEDYGQSNGVKDEERKHKDMKWAAMQRTVT